MATYIDITNKVAGDDLDLAITITNLPAGAVIVKAWLTIKSKPTDTDANAVIQKVITTGFAHSGSSSVTVSFTISLSATETSLLQPGRPYFYDIQIKDSLNKLDTPIRGAITLTQGQTQST